MVGLAITVGAGCAERRRRGEVKRLRFAGCFGPGAVRIQIMSGMRKGPGHRKLLMYDQYRCMLVPGVRLQMMILDRCAGDRMSEQTRADVTRVPPWDERPRESSGFEAARRQPTVRGCQ